MNEVVLSRTDAEHMIVIQEFLKEFHLHEITFLAHMNTIYSIYDLYRIERMTTQLRLTFGTDHDISHIRTLLEFFSDRSRQPQIWHHINIQQHLLEDAGAHHAEPCLSICPDCQQNLNQNHCNVTRVSICYQRGKVLPGFVYSLTCKHKKKTLGDYGEPLTIYPNFVERENKKIFTMNSLKHGDIVYMGGKYAYERALIEQYSADLVTNAHSWMKTADSLNLQAFNGEQHQEQIIDRRTLARLVYMYNVVQFDLFLGSTRVELPYALDKFDDWAWMTYPRLLTSFIFFWSRHKEILGPCNGIKCSEALVVDGHQKCRRRVCKFKDIEIKTDLFENMIIGCCRTPTRNSKYCTLHAFQHETDSESSTQAVRRRYPVLLRLRQWKRSKEKLKTNFGATNCRTSKERSNSYVRRCGRSFGVIASVTNCGVVTNFGEIFRSETLKEILQLLTNCIKASGVAPKTAVYDDGCHLVKFLRNHIGKDLHATDAAKQLAAVKFSVDRTHFRNHVGLWCRQNMNPNDNPQNVNTQAAEQLFGWLKGYAPIISSLGWRRASIFLLILFHHKNLSTTRTKCDIVIPITDQVPVVPHISMMHMADAVSIMRDTDNFKTPLDPKNCQKQTNNLHEADNPRAIRTTQTLTNTEINVVQPHTKTDWRALVKRILEKSNPTTSKKPRHQ